MTRQVLAALAIVFAATSSWAAGKTTGDQPMEMQRSGPGQATSARIETVKAKVKAVDPATRMLTVDGPRGEQTFKVSSDVKRLDEVAPGDTIALTVTQNLVLQALKKGETVERSGGLTAETAGKDEAPGARMASQMRGTVTVVAVDKPTRIAVLEGSDGTLYKVKAGKDINLDKVKSGTKLMAIYGESMAVNVVKAAAQ